MIDLNWLFGVCCLSIGLSLVLVFGNIPVYIGVILISLFVYNAEKHHESR